MAVIHEEHTVRTRVHTQPNARLQGLVLYTDEHATSLTHTAAVKTGNVPVDRPPSQAGQRFLWGGHPRLGSAQLWHPGM